ncbi:MAG TPA: T9SS type A sorting domain-containing protein [Chitinophagales bacterium]|nr:T9SS type A sorting domain-containing protein [Chitinophagales bacterium]
MKSNTLYPKIMLLAILIAAIQLLPAQDTAQAQKKYRLCIVKVENGNKEVIDRNFSSKEELDAYVKDNKLEAPEEGDLPVPPVPPAPPAPPAKPGKKGKAMQHEKKIIIIEKEEGSMDGQPDLMVDLSSLGDEDRAKALQELMDMVKGNVEVVHLQKKKAVVNTIPPAGNSQPPADVDGSTADVSGVNVYPNPGNGQFHLVFSVAKPLNVQVRITNMQGKEVYAEALNNYSGQYNKEINAPGLASGNYLLSIEAGGQKIVRQWRMMQ